VKIFQEVLGGYFLTNSVDELKAKDNMEMVDEDMSPSPVPQ